MYAALVTALESALGVVRVFPDTAPAGAAPPYCIWQQVGGQAVTAMCGGVPARNARIQIWIWATTRKQANDLMRDAEDALTGSPMLAVPLGAMATTYEDVLGFYGSQQDFSLWQAA